MSEQKKHVDMPPDREHLDFLTSILLFAVSVAAIILSFGYWRAVGGEFYASPGFMPTIIAAFLLVMAAILFANSLKGSSVSERLRQLGAALPRTLHSRTKALCSSCTEGEEKAKKPKSSSVRRQAEKEALCNREAAQAAYHRSDG